MFVPAAQEEGAAALTVMCALRLLTIEQKLADEAVVDTVTRQACRRAALLSA